MKTKFRATKRQVATAFRQAANWLEKNPQRWAQGSFRTGLTEEDYCYCGSGILNIKQNEAEGTNPKIVSQGPWFDARWVYIPGTPGLQHLPKFNDLPGRTVEEVIASLRLTAKILDHGGDIVRRDIGGFCVKPDGFGGNTL